MKSVNFASIFAIAVLSVCAALFDAKAASLDAETRFTSQVCAAFDTKDSAKLLGLVCWDNVEPALKQSLSQQFVNLVTLTAMKIELVMPDPKQTYEYSRGGITYRTNLTLIKQLKVEFKPGNPLNTTETLMPVGEKNGMLFITTAAPTN